MCDGWAGNTAPCAAAGNPGYAGDVRNASAGNSDDACTGAYPNSAPSTALGTVPGNKYDVGSNALGTAYGIDPGSIGVARNDPGNDAPQMLNKH